MFNLSPIYSAHESLNHISIGPMTTAARDPTSRTISARDRSNESPLLGQAVYVRKCVVYVNEVVTCFVTLRSPQNHLTGDSFASNYST